MSAVEQGGGGRLSADEVRKVARLSRLELGDDKLRAYAEQMTSILGYIERLRAMDLEGVEPMAHPLDATNRLDADEPRKGLDPSVLARMAPESVGPFVKVPKVLGEGGGA